MDIPEDLLETARRAMDLRTKREAVIAGLEELIKKSERDELRGLAGRMRLRVSIPRSRRRKGS